MDMDKVSIDFWELDSVADRLAQMDMDEDAERLATIIASAVAILRSGGSITIDGDCLTITAT